MMNQPTLVARPDSVLTLVLLCMIAVSSLGCFFFGDDEERPTNNMQGAACDVETFPTTCNEDGTVTYCELMGCGFGPCTPEQVVVVECIGCMVVERGADNGPFMCQNPDDMGASTDMSATQDMSGL